MSGGSGEGALGTGPDDSFPVVDLVRPRVRLPRNRAPSDAAVLSEELISLALLCSKAMVKRCDKTVLLYSISARGLG